MREEMEEGSIASDPLPLDEGRVRQMNASKGPHLKMVVGMPLFTPVLVLLGLLLLLVPRGEEGREEEEEGIEEEEEEEEEE